MNETPQPGVERITPFARNALVVGIEPGQPEIVVVTAARLAETLHAKVYFAYADPERITEREFPDGTVQHGGLDPDFSGDEIWQAKRDKLIAALRNTLLSSPVDWEFRYLAGRADRALTHLARAVDASMIVVGTRRPGGGRVKRLLEGTLGRHLAHHQHRPVLIIPTTVVDWKIPLE
ncbi:universal stress protein [Propionimicrobium sp. PCR01-08-3]|uniref:universal stress protein n=1 Tax=Propionimicrobium sp. PCR01-08-3 TaxID=3052086 RepID=UPI00255D00D7|nr:universal stress protein [Propionimicrobium sp. PCR01-08-3]WIY82204.1 universal stress protein [Propionimicrobium sp. PCR01-08-3]